PSVVSALVVLVVFNLAIAAATRVTARRKFLARLEHAPRETRLLFLGNSLFEEGIDVDALVASWRPVGQAPVAFNAALHATTPVEHALILKQALPRLPQVRDIVYGYFDDQLSLRSNTGWRDMISSRALAYCFPEEAAALYAPGSWVTAWSFRAMSLLPMLAERTTIWSKVETLRKAMGAWGMSADTAPKEDLDELAWRLGRVVQEDRGLSPAVKELFRLAETRGARMIVVAMPDGRPPGFHDGPAPRALRAYNRAKVEAAHGLYIDASQWVTERKYYKADGVHLNPEGARLFSERLGRELSRGLDRSSD
ncbi:MAG TPA: SGNH/GDSL hydrolase family protein, partial [Cystobacter sp.]